MNTVAGHAMETDPIPTFLKVGGTMGRAIAAHDWAATPLGPIDAWTPELRTTCSIMLQAGYPAALWWGRERTALYNDDYVAILGNRPPGLGKPFAQVWPDLASNIGVQFDEIFRTGRVSSGYDERVDIVREGRLAEHYWNYSFTPIIDAKGDVHGILNSVRDTTLTVMQRRTSSLLLGLDAKLTKADDLDAMIDVALAVIGEYLGARRTGLGEIADATLRIRRCWTAGSMPDICGQYPLGSFGDISADLEHGKTVRIVDNRTDPRTADPAIVALYEQIGLRSGIVVPIIDRGRYVGGVFVQDAVARHWSDHEAALAEAATKHLWQALVRARAEASLRESEQRFRLIFEQANDIIFTADIDQRITAANPAGARALGYAPDEIIGKSIAEFVSPIDYVQTTLMLNRKLIDGGHTRHEVGVTGRDGKIMRWENDSALIIDADRKPIGLLSISRDVTERRAFDERRELLIHELNHRVKNTLSLVQGLAHQSFRQGQDKGQASADFLARLSALSVAHDLLTRDQWEGATIAELVRGATAHAGDRVAGSGPHLLVSPKSAVALVMALHELTTNAFKYGALSEPPGRVAVSWHRAPSNRFVLTWHETGGPAVVPPAQRGFGVRMIERVLASDLGGTVNIDFAQSGIVCTIDGPVLT